MKTSPSTGLIACQLKETDKDYLARTARSQTIGMACSGNRLGCKVPITADTRFSRAWQLNGCPRHWDMMQVAAIVEAHFHDVKMIRQSVRGTDKTFLFRGAAKEGADCDLLPIAAEDGNAGGRLMLWAAIAPARKEQVKQKRLRNGSRPFVLHEQETFATVVSTVSVPASGTQPAEGTPMELDATDKVPPGVPKSPSSEETACKKQKVAVRALPPQCTLQPVPKDGNCLFHAVGAGLRWPKSQPNAFHHSCVREWLTISIAARPTTSLLGLRTAAPGRMAPLLLSGQTSSPRLRCQVSSLVKWNLRRCVDCSPSG